MSADGTWRTVTHASPCPICGKGDWCGRSGDVVRCMRVSDAPSGWRAIKSDEHGGTVFAQESIAPEQDFAHLHTQFLRSITRERLEHLAQLLGVRPESLEAIECGWTGALWTFPERDGRGRIIGIATRTERGRKKVLPGGKRGLIIPRDVPASGLVLIVEGPSDVAACHSMGLAAVGRPSAAGGVAHLAELLRGREVLVLGENDKKPDGKHPGRSGAEGVASKLALSWRQPIRWALPPQSSKDVRQWLQHRQQM